MLESNGRVRAPAVAMVYQIYCFPALSDLFLSLIRRSVYGDRAFSNIAPRLWNSIPNDIRHIMNIQTLKTKLKTYLFKKYLDNSPLF